MKKVILWVILLAAVWGLPRLSHPAMDIGKLEPVETVLITAGGTIIRLETDSGAEGSGRTLVEAIEDLRRSAPGEVYLDTANKILIKGDMNDWQQEILDTFRPSSRVCRVKGTVGLQEATEYLAVHKPEMTLNQLRLGEGSLETLIIEEGRGRLEPG